MPFCCKIVEKCFTFILLPYQPGSRLQTTSAVSSAPVRIPFKPKYSTQQDPDHRNKIILCEQTKNIFTSYLKHNNFSTKKTFLRVFFSSDAYKSYGLYQICFSFFLVPESISCMIRFDVRE